MAGPLIETGWVGRAAPPANAFEAAIRVVVDAYLLRPRLRVPGLVWRGARCALRKVCGRMEKARNICGEVDQNEST